MQWHSRKVGVRWKLINIFLKVTVLGVNLKALGFFYHLLLWLTDVWGITSCLLFLWRLWKRLPVRDDQPLSPACRNKSPASQEEGSQFLVFASSMTNVTPFGDAGGTLLCDQTETLVSLSVHDWEFTVTLLIVRRQSPNQWKTSLSVSHWKN